MYFGPFHTTCYDWPTDGVLDTYPKKYKWSGSGVVVHGNLLTVHTWNHSNRQKLALTGLKLEEYCTYAHYGLRDKQEMIQLPWKGIVTYNWVATRCRVYCILAPYSSMDQGSGVLTDDINPVNGLVLPNRTLYFVYSRNRWSEETPPLTNETTREECCSGPDGRLFQLNEYVLTCTDARAFDTHNMVLTNAQRLNFE